MKKVLGLPLVAVSACLLMASAPTNAAQKNGATASGFYLKNMSGKTVRLSQFRGKTVVLEWHNPGCPFVKKHYQSRNMQSSQKTAIRDGAVWLTINSAAAGKQGHMNGPQARSMFKNQGMSSSEYLLDPQGVVGKAYAAKTTPHMYIINKAGILVYQGGIDNKPTANQADIKIARNHVLAALAELRAGKPISIGRSRPYGCTVKYAR